jgi:hypothetical protein
MLTTTNFWKPNLLQNELVTLTPLSNNDFEKLYLAASDPLIWEQHPQKDRYKKEVFSKYFEGALLSDTAFLVRNTATNEVIGCTRYYDINEPESKVGIGYTFFSRSTWGKGFNLASKHLMLKHAFQRVDTVLSLIGVQNIRSQIAIEKLGAKKGKTIDYQLESMIVPHFEYVINKKDYFEKYQS